MQDKLKLRIKKIATVLALVFLLPASLVIGLAIADPFYMRYQYEGLVQDFAPGDSFGVLIDGLIFAFLIFAPTFWFLLKLLERLLRQSREPTR